MNQLGVGRCGRSPDAPARTSPELQPYQLRDAAALRPVVPQAFASSRYVSRAELRRLSFLVTRRVRLSTPPSERKTTMPTYQEYQEQIAKLQTLAEQARQVELVEARRKIQQLMQLHGLNNSDFAGKSKKTKTSTEKGTVQAKYRDPETGATWSGRGRAPLWLKGREKGDFLIK